MPMVNFLAGDGVSESDWHVIRLALDAQGVPDTLSAEVRPLVGASASGVLLYGSWARGDAHGESDLDVLVLDEVEVAQRSTRQVSVSYYTADQLSSATRTLFGLHLKRDGHILFDRNGHLRAALELIQQPIPGELLSKINTLSAVLAVSPGDLRDYLPGLIKVARYLLRSALYAEALEAGQPCFSIPEIAQRRKEPELISILSSHATVHPPPSIEHYADLRARLTKAVGPAPKNDFGSLEALIVGTWQSNAELSNLATLALGQDDDSLPYSWMPKVIL